MLERIEELTIKYEELGLMINDPDVIADQSKWRTLMKEYSDMTPIIEKYNDIERSIYNKIITLSIMIEKARQTRDRLLPKLMSGELEVE